MHCPDLIIPLTGKCRDHALLDGKGKSRERHVKIKDDLIPQLRLQMEPQCFGHRFRRADRNSGEVNEPIGAHSRDRLVDRAMAAAGAQGRRPCADRAREKLSEAAIPGAMRPCSVLSIRIALLMIV